jgi:hypothetical protein
VIVLRSEYQDKNPKRGGISGEITLRATGTSQPEFRFLFGER